MVYKNSRRPALLGVLPRPPPPAFCRYLTRKFPIYDSFAVLYGLYPDVVATPDRVEYQVAYRCE